MGAGRRSAKRIPRQPDLLIGFTVQPLMFVLLFVYVFGGAISTPGFSYVDFLIPGIIVQTMAFGGFVTALGLSEDLKKGLMDRFRSLPMARSAVLTGRTLADVSTNVVQLVVVLGVGLLVGFDFKTGLRRRRRRDRAPAPDRLLLLVGVRLRRPRGVVSRRPPTPTGSRSSSRSRSSLRRSCPVASLPSWLQPAAENNPFTIMVNAVRGLFLGIPVGNDVWLAVAWSVGIAVVFGDARDLALPARRREVERQPPP